MNLALLVIFCHVSGCYRKAVVKQTANVRAGSTNASNVRGDETLFDNVHLDVKYVSDSTCAECHPGIAASYSQHPMGNSMLALTDSNVVADGLQEAFEESNRATFESNAFVYNASVSDGKLMHGRSLVGGPDQPELRESHAVAFVVGSGQKGRSYFVNRNDHLFMSPLTWYPQKRIWDLSPGYEHNDLGFNRPVLEDCLFCHANQASLVSDQKNQFDLSATEGHSIGCQRCHGPGELHVQMHALSDSPSDTVEDHSNDTYDRSIANPKHMPPSMREDVCQQCHLAGAARITKAGKSRFDFRPGTHLDDTLGVYVVNPKLPQNQEHFVGQVEQMVKSQCYVGSDGALGCVSCHDPHSKPKPTERVAFYRQRCVECHASAGCSKPVARRLDSDGVDNCIACHMPPISTDVRHASTTDHRVPRHVLPQDLAQQSATEQTEDASKGKKTKNGWPIVKFDNGLNERAGRNAKSSDEADRDLALATLEAALYHPQKITTHHLLQVTPPLARYAAIHKFDWEAQEALGDLLTRTSQRGALEPYRKLLNRKPDREHSAVMLANACLARGDFEQAISRWLEVVERHAAVPAYLEKLCQAYERAGRWRELHEQAQRGTQLFPTIEGFWRKLATSSLALNDVGTAERSLEVLVRFRPNDADVIKTWFEKLRSRR